MGECLDALVKLMEEMTSDQVEGAAGEVAYQFQGCKGWQNALSSYDRKDIPLILAIRCRKFEEIETLKKRWEKPVSSGSLAMIFGLTKRVIQDGCKLVTYHKGKVVDPSPPGGKRETDPKMTTTQATQPKKLRCAQTTLLPKGEVP